ncbi:MAG: hypothetical protein CHACPFDD_01445 [Phycisphaerae bacterium]|nr:hypothetical protein [Phycisphaerae bacterium]
MPRASRFAAPMLALAAAALPLFAGCSAAGEAGTGVVSASRPAEPQACPRDNAALVDFVSEQPRVTAEAAYRVAYVLWKGEAFAGEFDELRGVLNAGGVASPLWQHRTDDVLSRAALAHLICRAADIRSGINWTLFGCGRYAWRELQYLRIADAGSEWTRPTGGEFLGLVRRADAWRARRSESQAAQLGERPSQ